jgi:hypothetical protein
MYGSGPSKCCSGREYGGLASMYGSGACYGQYLPDLGLLVELPVAIAAASTAECAAADRQADAAAAK